MPRKSRKSKKVEEEPIEEVEVEESDVEEEESDVEEEEEVEAVEETKPKKGGRKKKGKRAPPSIEELPEDLAEEDVFLCAFPRKVYACRVLEYPYEDEEYKYEGKAYVEFLGYNSSKYSVVTIGKLHDFDEVNFVEAVQNKNIPIGRGLEIIYKVAEELEIKLPDIDKVPAKERKPKKKRGAKKKKEDKKDKKSKK
ncbi:hypothetical protein PCE1_001006 [Barthelona sp. PCE]